MLKIKNVTRALTLSLTLLILLPLLCGCVTLVYDFEDIDNGKVESISFYDLSGYAEKSSEELLSSEPFFTLPAEEHDEFIAELKKLEFKDSFPIFMPSDPSFSYGAYVVRFEFDDGSSRYLSCTGYNETFDADGKWISSDHYGCNDESWNDLIYAFCGERSSRICYHSAEFVITVKDHARFADILLSAKPIDGGSSYKFSSDDYIKFNGKQYYLAEDNEPIFRVDGEFYELSDKDIKELYSIIVKYISFWRYGELDP